VDKFLLPHDHAVDRAWEELERLAALDDFSLDRTDVA
jgi:hypothetical protein